MTLTTDDRSATARGLTAEQIGRYHADGYLIVPDLLSASEIDAFLEHEARHKVCATAGLHGHVKDRQYHYVATHPNIAGGASQLLGDVDVHIVQTMFLDKPARGGQGIALHQDSHYLPSEPNTLMACWVAMTDADPSNGGLCVVPGSHKGPLRATHQTQNDKDHVSWVTEYPMRDRDGREWKQKMYSFEITDLDPATVVRLTVPRGAGVYFTGMTIHGSFANQSADRPRIAFATHYVAEGTWLFRRDVQETMKVEMGK